MRWVFFQIAFISLFTFCSFLVFPDLHEIMENHSKNSITAIAGFFIIVIDTYGSLIKSRELGDHFRPESETFFNRFFGFFWFLRIIPLAFGALVTVIAATGEKISGENGLAIALLSFEAFRWAILGFIVHKRITSLKPKTISQTQKLAGDLAILLSCLFYLGCMWYGTGDNQLHWSDLKGSDWFTYYLPGVLLFIIIYLPVNIFQFLDNVILLRTKADQLRFWISLIVIALLAITYPLV